MENKNRQPLQKQYGSLQGTPLHLYFCRTEENRKNKTILYFHGGGLVYGSAKDLPEPYLRLLLAAGYDFAAIEYPLAPETSLPELLEKSAEAVCWFQKHYADELQLSSADYILFGRSAGAYLAIMTARKMEMKPEALLLLYGYHTLQEASFRVPSRHYLAFPKVEKRIADQLVRQQPIVEGLKESRFALYIHYRQTGGWIKELLPPDYSAGEFSLSDQELASLPPAFLAAGTEDPDVPYRLSKKMSQLIPGSHLETVDAKEHDFDRTHLDTLGLAVYQKMLAWLESH